MSHRPAACDIAVIGAGHVVVEAGEPGCDPVPHLRVKKLRKYMGKQDDLALVAASAAIQSAVCVPTSARDRIGLYLGVGYIPFEQQELTRLAARAEDEGRFSMQRLSTTGFHAVNGLLTFQCLPNMPAFHISTNLDIQGPCFVTYPGSGQFYVALEQACYALQDHEVDVALVAGVADQQNFLVQHHFKRLRHRQKAILVDAAGCLVLQRMKGPSETGIQRPIGILRDFAIQYEAFDPFAGELDPSESVCCGEDAWEDCRLAMGPAALPVLLSQAIDQRRCAVATGFYHQVVSRDGIRASSEWELL